MANATTHASAHAAAPGAVHARHDEPGPELRDALAEPVGPIEAFIDRYVGQSDIPPNLRDAVRYALLGGGKRLRPVLAWHCAVAAGGRGEQSLPAGAAVELVHAFSLVHDDLPAMDDDDMR
ncbi:MAG: polyprenyl synthetase family protein, partial [Phycisphaeraceae bacterium]|nr:polyprenyl synthetase family protein [Phycisphaeraceae bacterium]